MAKGLNIDEILASLEQDKTAEETFAEGVVDSDAPTPDAPTPDESTPDESTPDDADATSKEKTATAVEEPSSKTNEANPDDAPDLEKVAAEYDAQGRIMAKAFMDELQKLAVGDGPYTPITDDAKKGINELVKGDIPEGGKVDAVVAKLKEMEAVARSGSYVQTNAEATPAPAKAPDETAGSTSSDSRIKAASADNTEESPETRIINNLYNTYFQEEDSNE